MQKNVIFWNLKNIWSCLVKVFLQTPWIKDEIQVFKGRDYQEYLVNLNLFCCDSSIQCVLKLCFLFICGVWGVSNYQFCGLSTEITFHYYYFFFCKRPFWTLTYFNAFKLKLPKFSFLNLMCFQFSRGFLHMMLYCFSCILWCARRMYRRLISSSPVNFNMRYSLYCYCFKSRVFLFIITDSFFSHCIN